MNAVLGSSTLSPMAAGRRKQIDALLAQLKLLPSSIAVPMRVLELKRRDASNAAEFAKVIAADTALAAKVLALANSAAFAPAAPVTRLSTAVGLIGINNLLPLLFGLALGGIFNKLALPGPEQ